MDAVFVQDLITRTAKTGTVRGLHFQSPPKAQAKLVRVARGRIFDVALDLRPGSETFGRHVSAILDSAEGLQIYIPKGFAHGFCTLDDDTEIVYKLSDGYAPDLSRGVKWNDPALAIDWPVAEGDAILSDKDMKLPMLEDQP